MKSLSESNVPLSTTQRCVYNQQRQEQTPNQANAKLETSAWNIKALSIQSPHLLCFLDLS